jgi:uncharacterized tellurite resistance protein B-like protein
MSNDNLKLIDRINHIKNLFLLGKSDQNLSEKEIDIITQIAKQHGLKYQDVNYILSHSSEIPFSMPDSLTERLAALYDLVLLMVADLEIHPNEKAFCIDIAIKYEFNPQIVDELIEDVLSFIIEGKECDEAIEYLVKYAHPKNSLN